MNPRATEYQWDFFIAYAGPDEVIAEDLYESLKNDSRAFLASRCLELGDDWDLMLPAAQERSLVTVVLISAGTDRAYYQREEIAAAIALARAEGSHRVVPVYLNGEAAMAKSVPYGLRLKHGITLSDSLGLNDLREKLLQLLSRIQNVSAVAATNVRPSPDLVMIIDVEASSTEPWQLPATALSYQLTRSDSLVRIQPSMRYLEILQGGGPIKPITYVRDPFSWEFPNLDFKVVNNGHRTVFLTEVCFDIARSCLDPSPVLVVRRDSYGSNALHFVISNQGWGPVRNLRARFHLTPLETSVKSPDSASSFFQALGVDQVDLAVLNSVTVCQYGDESAFSFVNKDGCRQTLSLVTPLETNAKSPNFQEPYPHEVLVGDFLEDTNVNIASCFQAAGVDLAALNSLTVRRQYGDEATFVNKEGRKQTVPVGELEQLQSACMGEFKENGAIVSGELVYEATVKEAVQECRVKFFTVVHIVDENGKGAARSPTYQYATKFDVDGNDYKRRVAISHVLRAGEADRFSLKIGMDKSSLHSFTVRLVYNGDHELISPKIEMLGFVPRSGARLKRRVRK